MSSSPAAPWFAGPWQSNAMLWPCTSRVAALPQRDRAYLTAFTVSLILCWLPFKWAGYVAPLFCLTWVIAAGRSGEVFRRTVWAGLALLGWVAVYWLCSERFEFSSGLLFVITHGSLALIWLFPGRELRNRELLSRMTSQAYKMVLLQGLFGILQGVYGYTLKGTFDRDNGDIVQGTLYPFFHSAGSFANPMYGASMTLMLLSLVQDARWRKLYVTAVVIGSMALVLASVVHQILFLLLAWALAYLLVRPPLPKKWGPWLSIALLAVLIPSLSLLLLPGNLSTIRQMTEDFLQGRSPRSLVLLRVLREMPDRYPQLPLVGVGPGQFSSRAALMNTGMFFGTPRAPKDYSPILQNVVPEPMADYLLHTWVANDGNRYYGSTQKPFFSWLSLYAETGLAGTMLLAATVLAALTRLSRSQADSMGRTRAFVCASMIWFLVLLGFQENYWEVPQAVLPGLFLTKVIHAQLSGR